MKPVSRMILTIGIGMAVGLGLGLTSAVRAEKPAPAAAATDAADNVGWEDARLLAEVLQRVRDNYVKPVDDTTLMRQAAHGLVEGLDEYSSFLDRDEYAELQLTTSGTYTGIGIEVDVRDSRVLIIRCLPSSPADIAGLRANDVITRIDALDVGADNFEAAIDEMRGEPGMPVKLRVLRAGKSLDFSVTRSQLELQSVSAQALGNGYGFIRISSFTETTAPEFESSLQALQAANQGALKGLIIDLRNNGGGVLDAAIDIADDLLERGRIVSADGRTEEARFVNDASAGDMSAGAPLAVLVNSGSASASEILAAALQDNQRATVIGRKTYGKGSVQTIMPLSGGRAIKLTTSHYYTPKGVSLDHRGIVPDIVLEGVERAAAELDGAGVAPTLAARDSAVGIALQALRRMRVASGNGASPPRT